jgi:hypothetical protein
MRNLIFLFVGILVLTMGCASDQGDEIARLRAEIADLEALAGPPPSSLDNLFPPKAEAPVYLFKMFELSTSLVGVGVDLSEKDSEQAQANFVRFKAQYEEVSKLVPEWENDYPMEPVEQLGMALEAGDEGKVMAAFEMVGKVCYDCHIVNMPKAWQKYHSGDFSTLNVTDPVTQKEVDYNEFMWNLESSLGGVTVDIEQGDMENALKHSVNLNARYQVLKETCYICHDTERHYYVDPGVQSLLDKLGATLKEASPDPKLAGEFVQGVGMESCFKCHLVHLPSVFAKARWEK